MTDHAGAEVADRRLDEIAQALESLARTPHIRDDIAPGFRTIPAGRKAVIAFTVDDERREVAIQAICYGGGDWVSREPHRWAGG